MKIRLALASLGLRRGEMCAVKYEDIDGTMLHIHVDMVQNKNNKWVYKEVPHRKEKSPQPCGLRACGTGESNMYKEFAYLCESKGITAYRIAKDCGFSNVTLSDWKNKGNMPKTDKLVKIARYLGTTVEYLVTGEDPAPAPAVRISSEEESLLSAYRSLNTTGRKKAAEYVSDLAGIDRYIKEVRSSAG